MDKQYLHLPVPPAQAMQWIDWADEGLKQPYMRERSTGVILAHTGNGQYDAGFFGFVLAGKYGDPHTAWEAFEASHHSLATLLQVDARAISGIQLWIDRVQPAWFGYTAGLIEMIWNGIEYTPPTTMPWKTAQARR